MKTVLRTPAVAAQVLRNLFLEPRGEGLGVIWVDGEMNVIDQYRYPLAGVVERIKRDLPKPTAWSCVLGRVTQPPENASIMEEIERMTALRDILKVKGLRLADYLLIDHHAIISFNLKGIM